MIVSMSDPQRERIAQARRVDRCDVVSAWRSPTRPHPTSGRDPRRRAPATSSRSRCSCLSRCRCCGGGSRRCGPRRPRWPAWSPTRSSGSEVVRCGIVLPVAFLFAFAAAAQPGRDADRPRAGARCRSSPAASTADGAASWPPSSSRHDGVLGDRQGRAGARTMGEELRGGRPSCARRATSVRGSRSRPIAPACRASSTSCSSAAWASWRGSPTRAPADDPRPRGRAGPDRAREPPHARGHAPGGRGPARRRPRRAEVAPADAHAARRAAGAREGRRARLASRATRACCRRRRAVRLPRRRAPALRRSRTPRTSTSPSASPTTRWSLPSPARHDGAPRAAIERARERARLHSGTLEATVRGGRAEARGSLPVLAVA